MADTMISGRIVQGSLSNPNTKNMEGIPLTNKDGTPRVEYFMAVAIPKDSPCWPVFLANVQGIAQAAWPQGQYNAPGFSWKYFDGDSVDKNGQPYSKREGMAGCWIVRLSSGFPVKCFSSLDGPLAEIPCDRIKCGSYVEVLYSCAGNGSTTQPGVYMNLQLVRLTGYGAEITTGPDGMAVFAGAAALPVGASAMPVGAASAVPSPAPTVAGPAAPVVPNTAVMAPTPPAPTPPPAPVDTHPLSDAAKAAGLTYAALKAANWSDEQMLAAGHITDHPPL